MSSKTIEQQQPPKQQSHFLSSFATGVAKATGGTILGITMITSSIVAGGLVGLAISFRNLPSVRVLKIMFLPKLAIFTILKVDY